MPTQPPPLKQPLPPFPLAPPLFPTGVTAFQSLKSPESLVTMASLVTASKPPSSRCIMKNTPHDNPTGNVLEWHDEAVNMSALIDPLLDKHGCCAYMVACDYTWGMMKSNIIPEIPHAPAILEVLDASGNVTTVGVA